LTLYTEIKQPPTAANLRDGFIDLGAGGNNFVDEQGNTLDVTSGGFFPNGFNGNLHTSTASA
jgi:hypothetical protein